ncbi:MAG: F-box protein, partial [Rhodoferax sp.]|nr:F-box protein [Rhodoferax sp.]
ADAAPVTFNDLPDDMLHEIFGRAFDESRLTVSAPPQGTHLALRSVCRHWRGVAYWMRLVRAAVHVDPSKLVDADAVRVRYLLPSKTSQVSLPPVPQDLPHSTLVPRAMASLAALNPELRRSMSTLIIDLCCPPSLPRAITTVTAFTALAELFLRWSMPLGMHKRSNALPSDVLAPLSALPLLEKLTLAIKVQASPEVTTLPALPEAPRLTRLGLIGFQNFVPVGSDAALGRLRTLLLLQTGTTREAMAAEDPLFLRSALDAGTWQPHRLTSLEDVGIKLQRVIELSFSLRLPRSSSRVGSEWAPLASQVTRLDVTGAFGLLREPSTGIIAGLGVLTTLRSLTICTPTGTVCDHNNVSPLVIDRLHAPHLTGLVNEWAFPPLNLAAFTRLVSVWVLSQAPGQAPLILRSLVALSHVRKLWLGNNNVSPPFVSLAELFISGSGLPALRELELQNMVLEWDTTGLDGAPTAADHVCDARADAAAVACRLDDLSKPKARTRCPTGSTSGLCWRVGGTWCRRCRRWCQARVWSHRQLAAPRCPHPTPTVMLTTQHTGRSGGPTLSPRTRAPWLAQRACRQPGWLPSTTRCRQVGRRRRDGRGI